MSNLEVIEECFIKHFKKFIQSLKSTKSIPFVSDNYDAIMLGIDFNHKKIIHVFMNEILQYEQQINNRDEQFFLNFDFNKKYSNLNNEINDIDNNDVSIDNIFQFKDNWRHLSEHNKNVIIDYMILLCKLAKAYKKEFDNL